MSPVTPVPALGFCFVPTLPPETLVHLARTVEAAGLDELWVWEDCFKNAGVAAAAAALGATSRIAVGIGLLPVPLRNAAITAMEFATLARLYPGRLIPGIGHGVQSWMEQVGERVASPMTLLREHTEAQRSLLAGESVTVAGRYVRLDNVRLDFPPEQPPPLMLGGGGPKSLALAGQLGAGTLLSAALSDDDVAQACAIVREARATTAVAVPGEHPIVGTQLIATGPGAQDRIEREVPRWGRRADEGIGVAGDAATIATALLRWADLGITSVAVQPTEDEPDLLGLIDFLGREVRPLLV
jgi:alkanesulfonate monooxygenase SsuD/methylene tetrahydromethanopterin reductase-like flavin-dependent oxidoreductase (luciferase family)